MTGSIQPVRIGFVGLGRMGTPMALRLLDAGWDLTVYNRTPAKAAAVVSAGARLAGSLAELRDLDVVISMVGTDHDLQDITTGAGGLLTAEAPLPLLIDCSTVSAAVSDQVRSTALNKGTDLLAAPVAGGPAVIASGGLAIVCSGASDQFEYARPVLAAMAPRVIYAGDGSASRRLKILHNIIAAVLVHALAEASVLAEALGLRRQDLLEFIQAGALGSPFIGYQAHAMQTLDFDPHFTSALMLKDVDLALDLARSVELPAPLTGQTRSAILGAIADGRGSMDIAALLLYIAESNHVQLHDASPATSTPDPGGPITPLAPLQSGQT